MKINSLQSIKFSLLAPVLSLIFAPQALLSKERPELCPQDQNLVTWCQKTLENDEKELQKELFTLVDVQSADEWNQAKKRILPDYDAACTYTTTRERANKPLPAELCTPIKNVLSNETVRTLLGITNIDCPADNMYIAAHRSNGKTVTFACGNKKIQADAATDQYTTLLDPEELLTTHKGTCELEATIAHELMHIAHEDDLNVFCLNQLQKTATGKAHKAKKEKFKRLKGEWERLQEKRADMLAGLVNLDYAKASTEQFKRTMDENEQLTLASTHPTGKMRYEYMQELTTTMEKQCASSNQQNVIFALILSFILLFGIGTMTVYSKKESALK